MRKYISVSLLSCSEHESFSCALALKEAGAHALHIDMMDGIFVPHYKMHTKDHIRRLKEAVNLPLEGHLMVSTPQDYLSWPFDSVAFHPQACQNPHEFLDELEKAGKKSNLVIDLDQNHGDWPSSWFQKAKGLILMGVKAGRGGQPFQDRVVSVLERIKRLWPHLWIGVDGGINEQTAKRVMQADELIVGSFVLKHPQGVAYAIKALTEC